MKFTKKEQSIIDAGKLLYDNYNNKYGLSNILDYVVGCLPRDTTRKMFTRPDNQEEKLILADKVRHVAEMIEDNTVLGSAQAFTALAETNKHYYNRLMNIADNRTKQNLYLAAVRYAKELETGNKEPSEFEITNAAKEYIKELYND